MNKLTISIGIPAYNEAKNIASLLHSILQQEQKNFLLQEIIVISDGSTDDTVSNVKNIKDKLIKIIDDGKRLGKSARLNQIFSIFTGDILVLMDADIIINDNTLLDIIVAKEDLSKAGIIAINTLPISAPNMFANCLNYSVIVQREIIKGWNKGSNYLAFRGACLVLTRKFAKTLHLPEKLVNNDAYLYFSALEKGYHPAYLEKTIIYYKSPSSFKDHFNQSSRFQSSQDELVKYLHINSKEYKIPLAILFQESLVYFIKNPLYFSGYIMIALATKLLRKQKLQVKWSVASSTKLIA